MLILEFPHNFIPNAEVEIVLRSATDREGYTYEEKIIGKAVYLIDGVIQNEKPEFLKQNHEANL